MFCIWFDVGHYVCCSYAAPSTLYCSFNDAVDTFIVCVLGLFLCIFHGCCALPGDNPKIFGFQVRSKKVATGVNLI